MNYGKLLSIFGEIVVTSLQRYKYFAKHCKDFEIFCRIF